MSSAEGDSEQIMVEPEPVVGHVAYKALLGAAFVVAVATYSTAVFATQIAGQRERHLVERPGRPVVILHFHAVVSVNAITMWHE